MKKRRNSQYLRFLRSLNNLRGIKLGINYQVGHQVNNFTEAQLVKITRFNSYFHGNANDVVRASTASTADYLLLYKVIFKIPPDKLPRGSNGLYDILGCRCTPSTKRFCDHMTLMLCG